MIDDLERQAIIDDEHLKLLSLGYKISAGMAALFAIFGMFYMFLGIVMSITFAHVPAAASKPNGPPPAFVGWIFAGIGVLIFLFAGGVASARFWASRCITRRKRRTFCMVVAGIGCLEFPYGTAIGILTFIVLGRRSVIAQFPPPTGP